jgi:hypothetical protein
MFVRMLVHEIVNSTLNYRENLVKLIAGDIQIHVIAAIIN